MSGAGSPWIPSAEGGEGGPSNVARVLFVCTGNICRSALAARYLASLPAARDLVVGSAGTHAVVGRGIDGTIRSCALDLGADLTGHRAHQLTGRLLEEAGLVIIFGPEHRDWIFRNAPEAFDRVISLAKAAAVLMAIGRHRLVMWDSLPELVRDRRPATSESDWIADPYRRGPEAARLAVRQIALGVEILASRVQWRSRRGGRHAR